LNYEGDKSSIFPAPALML